VLIAALFDTYSTLMAGNHRTDDRGEADKIVVSLQKSHA